MQVRLGWKFIFAFFALNGVISELHEQAHITTGRVITGCYGPRDFNVWESCAVNADLLPWAAPLAGPLFSYGVMWLGVWLLRAAGTRSLGLALVFAPLPFARILTAAMGGGDEKIFLLRLTHDALAPGAARWGALVITLLLAGPPIVVAWRALRNRWRTAYVVGFCVAPLLVIWAYKLRWLNGLLQQGVLAEPVVAGTPLFVLLVLGLMLVATALTWPWLRRAEG